MRVELGAPLTVTSGYRHPTHPVEAAKSGGPGAHATGKAVDIKCHGILAWRILGWRGPSYIDPTFSGIGVSQSGPQDQRFLHLDIIDKPEEFHAPGLGSGVTNEKATAIQLKDKATKVGRDFSNPDRELNKTGESFKVKSIRPLSDHMAAVIYIKSSNKLALALFYYIPAKERWEYFFPTDSHILGLSGFTELKQKVEEFNFDANF